MHLGELPGPAGLLLVPVHGAEALADGLPIRDLRFLEQDFDTQALHALDDDVDVLLPHRRDQHLLGLGLARDADHHVRLGHAVQHRRELVLVALAFRFDRHRDHRLRENDRREDHRVFLVAQRVAGVGFPEFGDGGEIAGADFGNGFEGFAEHLVERTRPLAHAARCVVDLVAGEPPREDAEQ